MRTPREDSEEILVTAKQFGWVFTYPDGDQSPELHLVEGQPVSLVMQSEDVLHSFYVPAFRQKMDIVPGRYTYAYIEPTKVGQYRLSCNEYCGTGHSKMKTMAEVHVSAEARKENTEWIEAEKPMWKNGEHIYQIQCSGCHKVDGSKATGPALNLIWGTQENYDGGKTTTVDRAYVQESIWYPNAKIVDGYAAKMNSFKGILDQQDINRVVSYLKYLKAKEDFKGTAEEFMAAHPEFSTDITEADMDETVPTAVEGNSLETTPPVPAATLESPGAAAMPLEVPVVETPMVTPSAPAIAAPVVTPALETPAVTPPMAAPAVTPPVAEPVVTPPVAAPVITPPVAAPVVTPPMAEPVVTPPVAEPVITPPVAAPVVTPPVAEPVVTPPVAEPVVTPPVAAPVVNPPAAGTVVEPPAVAAPVVETTESGPPIVAPATPIIETPAVIETPVLETPAVETPAVETPTVPAVEVPAVEVPALEVPSLEAPTN